MIMGCVCIMYDCDRIRCVAVFYIIIVSLIIIVLKFAYKYILVNISIQYLELIFGSYVLPYEEFGFRKIQGRRLGLLGRGIVTLFHGLFLGKYKR